jgi:uncharacterized Zn-binding protein involved in type VI secretion
MPTISAGLRNFVINGFDAAFDHSNITDGNEIAGARWEPTATDMERRQATASHYRCS